MEVKGIVTNEQVLEYINTTFKEQVVKFNTVCGKGVETLQSVEDVITACIQQSERVLEECIEALTAYQQKDTIERMDALVDILVTNVMLEEYLTKLVEFPQDEVSAALESFDSDSLIVLDVVRGVVDKCIIAAQGVGLFNPKQIYINCELICANNASKYTTDVATKEDWESKIDDTCYIREVEYEGETYYSNIRKSDGKIYKPYNFKEVIIEE